MKIEIKKGEFTEGYSWFIESTFEGIEEEDACHHATKSENGTYAVRAAVTAKNEGGFNGTAVCLDCILENAAKI